MAQLIIAEKPSAAQKIASALGRANKKKINGVYYFEIPEKKAYVVAAVGHLFSLSTFKQDYPVFDVCWKPVFKISKSSAFARKYFEVIEKLAKKCDQFIVATDYDIEGELIGWNIIRFICEQKDAHRMKFSTLTREELINSYRNRMKSIDWGQARAGETRHMLDWYYGINLSKAIMSAVSIAQNKFITLSIGRVQGPALAILAEREKEIQQFKPKPYWQIFAHIDLKKGIYEAIHKTEKFWDEQKAKQIFEKIKNKPATLSNIKKTIQKVNPPEPFDLTSLQIEAYRCFRISPKRTLSLAQDLYTSALISYPRTSSQKLPSKIGFKKILNNLAKNPKYSELAKLVLKTKLKPKQGKKTDPAHPAIYPTGNLPNKLHGDAAKIYDLIVKRFFAVFGEAGARESTHIDFKIEEEPFVLKGIRTIELGWQKLYEPYSQKKEIELPELVIGENYNEKTELKKDETKPPKRYTPASIIRELEKKNLGTKATRANVIEILRQRGYIRGTPIQVSDLGLKIVDTFSEYAPEIVSAKLTRKFEIALEKIRNNQTQKEEVLEDAKKVVKKICKEIDEHKIEIGRSISDALQATRKAEEESRTLMTCPKCKQGKLRVLFSKKTRKRFLACSQYPKCKTTFSLPQKGRLIMLNTKCEKCGANLISVKAFNKRAWKLCINCGAKI